MINNIRLKIILALTIIISVGIQGFSQSSMKNVSGYVFESGTNIPLQHVTIAVTAIGTVTDTDEKGKFSIDVPSFEAELTFYLPGYHRSGIFLNGKETLTVYLVNSKFVSIDQTYNKPLGTSVIKNEVYAVTAIPNNELSLNNTSSFDDAVQGVVPGLQVASHSGMPGHKSFLNLRGIKSIYGRNEPLLIIDGIVHDYNYANYGNMEGFTINPLEIVDIEDIADITVIKNGNSHLGVTGSNGLININTEQKSTASTLIKISGSMGVSMLPKKQKLLDGPEFNQYVRDVLAENGVTSEMAKEYHPWLFGEGPEKYRYGNNTNWQNEIYQIGLLQKYHIFLKGGDDIGTYNISTGIINHEGAIKNSALNRFNLRINGLVNITNKFSVTPNFKMSLTDAQIANMGPTYQRNPILSAILKAPIMAPNYIDPETGIELDYLDDVGAFGMSNPAKIVNDATGTSRNYHFGASVKLVYNFTEFLSISNLIGLNFNNARENNFIPNKGIAQVYWYEDNSPMDFVYEYRSLQNNTSLNYLKKSETGNTFDFQTGIKYMKNQYRYNKATDLNTASDDFKNLGAGGKFQYLRLNMGDNRDLLWAAYFANGSYSIKDKYIFNANVSVDANSAINEKNRINVFPSIGAAWRISSEEFLATNSNINDLKIRASFSQNGNMYSNVYDNSKLYYTEKRMNAIGVLVRESIPNPNLEMEKTSTINVGFDFSNKDQCLNVHFDTYYSLLNNMIIGQQLKPEFGFTQYFDNGGKLSNMGAELSIDFRKNFGKLTWLIGGNISANIASVTELNFINDKTNQIVTSVRGAEYVTKVGEAINAFYGYKTDGILTDNNAANAITGPKKVKMQAGDIKYVDNGDNIIDENDKTIIGNPNPDFFGGFFTGFQFDQWTINANFTYSYGNDIFNYTRYIGESMATYGNQFETVSNRWTNQNTNTTMPRASIGDPTGNTVFSDRWIEDGSYIKLKHLTISYNLPGSKFYSGIKVYLTATNLFTLSNYSGIDPEFFYMNSPFYMGIDYGNTPHVRSFMIGVKLDL